jgi:hypothetical protein
MLRVKPDFKIENHDFIMPGNLAGHEFESGKRKSGELLRNRWWKSLSGNQLKIE